VIVDVDGTLVDVSSIRHHVASDPKNFHAFHVESVSCPPHQWVVDWVKFCHALGFATIIVTGRSRKYERHTAMWLAMHDVPTTEMHMRPRGDMRPDVDIKRDILRSIERRFEIVEAIDDNPHVIKLWRTEGIPVTVVPGWP
jgi:hypothetical protein